jgi:Holliday junction resolvase-like predicted endonuclease
VEDFQASASAQGKAFEDAVETILRTSGCTIVGERFADPLSHEEIDLIVDTPNAIRIWVECKGSWNIGKKNIPGLRRSDTSKKAVATAWHLRFAHQDAEPPYLLVTSHLPKPGSYSDDLLKAAVADGLFVGVVAFTDLPEWLAVFDEEASAAVPVTPNGDDSGA